MIRNLPPQNRIILVSSAVFLCALGFSGCKKAQPPAAPVQQAKVVPAPPKPVLKPASSVQRLTPPPTNQFDFSNKRDPFKPVVIVKVVPVQSAVDAKKSARISLPIHSLDVNKFTLIGIITGGKQNQAMVVDPGKKGYVLKEGMKIGSNDGVVTKITNNEVIVEETYKDETGKTKKKTIPLTLPKKL